MFIENNRVTRSDVNQRILAACAYHKQSSEEDWIDRLKKNCLAKKQQQSTVLLNSEAHIIHHSVMSTVDTIMDALSSYTVLFNQDTEFELSLYATGPSVITEQGEETGTKGSYTGRISSRSWSLVVAGKQDCIDFFLIPSSQLLHLSHSEATVEPMCSLTALNNGRSVLWQLRNEVLHTAELSRVYQEAFAILIETIYQDMEDIVEKRNLERRNTSERRQADRRKTPQLWQGLSSPLVDRRQAHRRSEKNGRRNRVERRNTDEAEAVTEQNQEVELSVGAKAELEIFSAETKDWVRALEAQDAMNLLPEIPTLVEATIGDDEGWTSYQPLPEPIPAKNICEDEIPEQADNAQIVPQVSTEEFYEVDSTTELTAFDRALLRILAAEAEEAARNDVIAEQCVPNLTIESHTTEQLSVQIDSTECSTANRVENRAKAELELDAWVRQMLSIGAPTRESDQAANSYSEELEVCNSAIHNEQKIWRETDVVQEDILDSEEFAPGSDEQEIVQFLSRLALTIEPQTDACDTHLETLAGGVTMGRELSDAVTLSLRDLIEQEEHALNQVIKTGSDAFERTSLEQVQSCLEEAILRRRVLDIFTGLNKQWKEFANLENFVEHNTIELNYHSELNALQTHSSGTRVVLSIKMLMNYLLQLGAQSFQQMNFENVHTVSKYAAQLQRFQMRVEEVCGEQHLCDTKTSTAARRTSKHMGLVETAA